MRSTHDFLSEPSQSELLFLTTVVKDILAGDASVLKKTEQLIDELVAFMQREKLTLQHDENNRYNQQLLDLLIQAALDDEMNANDFNQRLAQWAAEYKAFVPADKQVTHARFVAQPPGILRTLMQGGNADNIYGDDYDARLLLKDLIIRNATEIKAGQFNVLAPVSLDAPDHLQSVIADVCKGHEDKNFGLLLLANCGQSHWRVVGVNLTAGSISKAVLWDPMHGDAVSLSTTPAYQHLQAVVNNLNGDESVVPDAIMQGTQSNGYSCMDRGVQKILQLVGVKNDITTAVTDDALRDAVEMVVCENHTELFSESDDEESVEEMHPLAALDYLSTQDDEELNELLLKPENKETQIQFDEVMARKLQASLDKLVVGDTRAAESPLLEEARNYAYGEMLKKFGVMAKPASTASIAPVVTAIPILGK